MCICTFMYTTHTCANGCKHILIIAYCPKLLLSVLYLAMEWSYKYFGFLGQSSSKVFIKHHVEECMTV